MHSPMKITTWNINGVKARLESALAYLKEQQPEVICFQEIKSIDEGFPREMFEELGYNVATHGQKGFNGVAILSKAPLEDVQRGLHGDETDTHARWIEALVPTPSGQMIRVVSIYLPNGNPIGTEKFTYKLAWMARFKARARELLADEIPLVLAGDLNVIPDPIDCKRPEAWVNDALFQPETRKAFHAILGLGFTDAIRTGHPEPGVYTFWDYQAGAFQKNDGIRIDHILLSPQASDRLVGTRIDKHVRGWLKPSDHVPVVIELAD